MSYYTIDLIFHIVLGVVCIVVSIVGFCIGAWLTAVLLLLVVICCVFLTILDIKEIKVLQWWDKQVMTKQFDVDYNGEEDCE